MKKLIALLFLSSTSLFGGATGHHTKARIRWIDITQQLPQEGDRIIVSDNKSIALITYEKNALLWKLKVVTRWMLASNIEGANNEASRKTGKVC